MERKISDLSEKDLRDIISEIANTVAYNVPVKRIEDAVQKGIKDQFLLMGMDTSPDGCVKWQKNLSFLNKLRTWSDRTGLVVIGLIVSAIAVIFGTGIKNIFK